ncbi:MAG: alpha/beta hydrolase family protein, partial [Gemmatimonadota bacterium]
MVIRIGILLLAALPATLRAQVAVEPGLAGTWTGAWGRAGDTLAVTMRFEEIDDVWSGSFDAERLRVEGIPFTEIAFKPPHVTIRLVGDQTTMVFDGRVDGDSLIGTLDEEGRFGWFAFARATAEPDLREEDARFRNGGVELAGTVILPLGPGPHPAVVFVHGSGAEGRWASRYLARRLARSGIAALIWDKRGVGESTGSWPEAGPEDMAGDAAAAVAFARSRPEMDSSRVGIHGHSQGGMLGPLIAVRSGADFVIASAASGVSFADGETYSIGNFIGIPGLPPEEAELARAYVEAIVDVAYRGAPMTEVEAAAERARGHTWYFDPPGPDDPYWLFSRKIADYDPLVWWRQVEVPVLFVYGSADERVPVEASRAAITAAIESAGRTSAEVRVFEGADHTFRVRRPGDEWPRTVTGYPEAILDWLRVEILTANG